MYRRLLSNQPLSDGITYWLYWSVPHVWSSELNKYIQPEPEVIRITKQQYDEIIGSDHPDSTAIDLGLVSPINDMYLSDYGEVTYSDLYNQFGDPTYMKKYMIPDINPGDFYMEFYWNSGMA